MIEMNLTEIRSEDLEVKRKWFNSVSSGRRGQVLAGFTTALLLSLDLANFRTISMTVDDSHVNLRKGVSLHPKTLQNLATCRSPVCCSSK
jgi:hypothetical protein